jgi:histidinol-phosphate aminotransferase
VNNHLKELPLFKETPGDGLVCMSRNENFAPPPYPSAPQGHLSVYPSNEKFRNLLAGINKVDPSQIILGAGGTGVLEICARAAFVGQGGVGVVDYNSYGPIENIIKLAGGDVRYAESTPVDGDYRARFIVNPNNPTGEFRNPINYNMDNFSLFVVDEAYMDFYPDSGRSFLPLVNERDNLVVVKTFSKLYGLAGMRVGYGVVSKKVASYLSKLESRYCISKTALQHATWAAYNIPKSDLGDSIHRNQHALAFLVDGLDKLGVEKLQPCANFIAAKIPDVKGFQLRDLTHYSNMAGWKRITSRSISTNEAFLSYLKTILESQK